MAQSQLIHFSPLSSILAKKQTQEAFLGSLNVVVVVWLLSYVWLVCNSMDYSLLVSPVHRILQARILEWVATSFSRGSSQLRGQTHVSVLGGRFFITELPGKTTSSLFLCLFYFLKNSYFIHSQSSQRFASFCFLMWWRQFTEAEVGDYSFIEQ